MKRKAWRTIALSLICTFGLGSTTALAAPGGGGKPPKGEPADPAIAYWSTAGVGTSKMGLSVVDEDGSNRTLLLSMDGQYHGWSPDGASIAFWYQGELWALDVVLVGGTPEATNLRNMPPVTSPPGAEPQSFAQVPPAWSPPGDVIACVENRPIWEGPSVVGNDATLWLVDAVPGGGGHLVTAAYEVQDGFVGYPTWSPDGSLLAFIQYDTLPQSGQMGPFHSICILAMSGGTGTLIQSIGPAELGLSEAADLDWASTDPAKLAFTSSGAVHIVDIATLTVTYVTTGFHPTWSPDDSHLAFVVLAGMHGQREDWEIRKIDLATGQVLSLAEGWWPDWRRASPP